MTQPALFVTNFNRNFTGVSATAAGVVGVQQTSLPLRLVGKPLPNCPVPVSQFEAWRLSRSAPDGRPFSIWHVRRNSEMQSAIFARDVLRLPIKIVFTSAAQRRHSAWPRWLISRMDAVIATTKVAASFVPNVRAVVPHGVDISRFTPSENREADWQALGYGGRFGLACVGRVRPEKGTDVFVDAMLDVLPKHPDAVALVVGKATGSHKAFLDEQKSKVKAAGLGDRLLFAGEVAADQMPALMRSLSLLVALPRYEGYGMTPLEAMASGVPFVASDTGFFKEFSGEGEAGRIVELGDVAGAASHIKSLLRSPDTTQNLSLNAVNRAREHYSIAKEAAGIQAVYDALWQDG